jgi:hypothetical protein
MPMTNTMHSTMRTMPSEPMITAHSVTARCPSDAAGGPARLYKGEGECGD